MNEDRMQMESSGMPVLLAAAGDVLALSRGGHLPGRDRLTMSLFIASLACGEGSAPPDAAKVGILAASRIAAIAGCILLRGDASTAAAGTPAEHGGSGGEGEGPACF